MLISVLAVVAAIIVVGVFYTLITQSDRNASAVLNSQKRRTGLSHAVATPEHYAHLRSLHTSRRVPQVGKTRNFF